MLPILCLFLKSPHPTNLGNFRSISLCNVLYKLVEKMIVNRFKEVLDVFIDNAQSAFVSGKLISDNVLLASEVLRTFR